MRKLLSLIAVLFIMSASYGLACQGDGCADATVNGNYQINAFDSDYSSDYTWNDGAYAEAGGNAGGTLDTFANAECITTWEWVQTGRWFWQGHFEEVQIPGFAQQFGTMDANADPSAWSWAKDYGLTSKAGAGAKFEGEVSSFGEAFGLGGERESVASDLYVNGSVYQENYAKETGYGAGGISGGNSSGGNFYSSDYDYDSGKGFASDYNTVNGSMITKGKTEVTIDPYGSYRSISGQTENFASVEDNNYLNSANVYGSGGIGGSISSYNGSFAGGSADFSYNGGTYGAGAACLDAQVSNGNASVSGSSYATGNCDNCGQVK